MPPKLLLPVLLVSILWTACNGSYSSEIKETWPNGTTRVIEYYKEKDGQKELYKMEEFYENGIKRIEGYYRDGQKDGRWSSYFPEGGVWSVVGYKNGEMHGKQTVYHPNGQKYYEGSFDNGIRKGTWSFWNEAGALVNTREY